jgi:predicted small metal-binding protein
MSNHPHTPAKHFACGVVVPGCTFVASAATEEDVMKQVVTHAAQAHGLTEITPELAERVRAAIKTE